MNQPLAPATTVLVALTSWHPAKRTWISDHFLVACSCGFTNATPNYKRAQDAAMHRFSHENAPERLPPQVNVQLRKRFVSDI